MFAITFLVPAAIHICEYSHTARVFILFIRVVYTLYCLNNMTSTDLQITAYLLKRSSNNQDKDILFSVIFTPC